MKTIGIYPGNFQPPHKGHYATYKKLRQVAGSDTFVITTDFDPTIEAALHFGDKEQILVRHGVPASHIRKVKKLDDPIEVLSNFDPETTVVIYALSHKNAVDKLNTSSYYKSLDFTGGKLRPFKYNSYILVVDDTKIGDKTFSSKNIREALGSHRFTTKQKEIWFKEFFGWFDLGLFELLKNKYTHAHQSDVFEPEDTPPPPEDIKETISKEIVKILNELMGLPDSTSINTEPGDASSATDDMQSDAEQRKQDQQNRQDLIQQKKELEDKKKMNKRQYDRDKTSAYNYDKYTRKQDQDKLDAINKQITQSSL